MEEHLEIYKLLDGGKQAAMLINQLWLPLAMCMQQRQELTLHFSLWIDDDTSIVLKIDEDTILSPPWLPLPHNHSWHDCRHRDV